ncbi:unnamed protein product [Phytomonas sp. EM1]|nr:unnamed protein product [Phytomonas sp. EM1]|eukprot:CCW65189.1 unnamed protein product [Phytomonas sp. isolate EM1]
MKEKNGSLNDVPWTALLNKCIDHPSQQSILTKEELNNRMRHMTGRIKSLKIRSNRVEEQ